MLRLVTLNFAIVTVVAIVIWFIGRVCRRRRDAGRRYELDIRDRNVADAIENGIKRVEGRKGVNAYRMIKTGDTIVFTNEGRRIICEVEYVHNYQSIFEYLCDEWHHNPVPGVIGIEAAEAYYRSLPGDWSPECIKRVGMLGIGIKYLRTEPR